MTSRSHFNSWCAGLAPALVFAGACGGTEKLDHSPNDASSLTDSPSSDPDTAGDAPVVRSNQGSLLFDGADDFLRVPHNDALTGLSGVTIEAWVKPRTMTSSAGIAIKARSNVSNASSTGSTAARSGRGAATSPARASDARWVASTSWSTSGPTSR
jgi:hypothetical protein